jgi:hypothetical protein
MSRIGTGGVPRRTARGRGVPENMRMDRRAALLDAVEPHAIICVLGMNASGLEDAKSLATVPVSSGCGR